MSSKNGQYKFKSKKFHHKKPTKKRRGGGHRRFHSGLLCTDSPRSREEVSTFNNVINVSHRALSDEETSLLSKGLNFCPHAHFDPFNTILDINKIIRNLTVRRHYYDEDNSDIDTNEMLC